MQNDQNSVDFGDATPRRGHPIGGLAQGRVPEAGLEWVFEPFVRIEASRSRDTGGSGLGLAIARGIVRGQGGGVRLENRAGGGLRATVALPGAGGARSARGGTGGGRGTDRPGRS